MTLRVTALQSYRPLTSSASGCDARLMREIARGQKPGCQAMREPHASSTLYSHPDSWCALVGRSGSSCPSQKRLRKGSLLCHGCSACLP